MNTKQTTSKVAVTIWEDRISPVFDASSRLLVAEIDRGKVSGQSFMMFDPAMPSHLARTLRQLDVPVLICGAISRVPANLIHAGGIILMPFITGKADRILQAYAQGRPLAPTFVMPGCRNTVVDPIETAG